MIHCAIIGAGQIGSRHLQALSYLENPTRIHLVDPSDESLKTAQNRFAEVSYQKNYDIGVYYHNHQDELPDVLDLVIVATNSNVREKVIKNIIQKYSVKNFILEKVLFQKKAQYVEIDQILKESSIATWVSCWMRTTKLYKKIKQLLNYEEQIQMKIEGPQWGMGCNSIHFLDLFAYLTNTESFKFTEIALENHILEAKRAGFKEFLGRIAGKNSRGNTLELICHETGEKPTTVKICNGSNKFEISGSMDNLDNIILKTFSNEEIRTDKTTLPYHSQLTHIWVNDILSRGTCDLPTYAESIPLHLELIRVFNDHLEKITGKEIEECPIT